MPFTDYKTALVTGASTGMGAAIAETLAKRGLTVHAVARNAAKLDELAEPHRRMRPLPSTSPTPPR